MKLVKIISEHKKKAKLGMVEAIVKLADGSLVTRHIYPSDAAKEDALNRIEPRQMEQA